MPTETTETPVTAFMLVKTTPEWLAMTVEQRTHAFATEVVPVVKARTTGVRSRFYDTEFYSARVTDVWVWEAVDHHAYQLLVDALRETPSGTATSRSSTSSSAPRTATPAPTASTPSPPSPPDTASVGRDLA